jgi:hypothetical protein
VQFEQPQLFNTLRGEWLGQVQQSLKSPTLTEVALLTKRGRLDLSSQFAGPGEPDVQDYPRGPAFGNRSCQNASHPGPPFVGAPSLAHHLPTGCVYDFPTSSEGKFPDLVVDLGKKRQYTPLKIETVTDAQKEEPIMETVYYAARANLRRLILLHPSWTRSQLAQATGMSRS